MSLLAAVAAFYEQDRDHPAALEHITHALGDIHRRHCVLIGDTEGYLRRNLALEAASVSHFESAIDDEPLLRQSLAVVATLETLDAGEILRDVGALKKVAAVDFIALIACHSVECARDIDRTSMQRRFSISVAAGDSWSAGRMMNRDVLNNHLSLNEVVLLDSGGCLSMEVSTRSIKIAFIDECHDMLHQLGFGTSEVLSCGTSRLLPGAAQRIIIGHA